MKRWVLAVMFVVGCGGQAKPAQTPIQPASRCDQVSDHVISLMTASKHAAPEDVDPYRQLLARRCNEDRWGADAQQCMLVATTLQEAGACNDKLSAEQQDKLQKEGQALSHRAPETEQKEDASAGGAPPPPPAARPAPVPATRAPQPKGGRKTGDPCEGGQ